MRSKDCVAGTKVRVKFPVNDIDIPGPMVNGTIAERMPIFMYDVYVKMDNGDLVPYYYKELKKAK